MSSDLRFVTGLLTDLRNLLEIGTREVDIFRCLYLWGHLELEVQVETSEQPRQALSSRHFNFGGFVRVEIILQVKKKSMSSTIHDSQGRRIYRDDSDKACGWETNNLQTHFYLVLCFCDCWRVSGIKFTSRGPEKVFSTRLCERGTWVLFHNDITLMQTRVTMG